MDALVKGLEVKLQEWEADLNESYDLIRDVKSKKAKAVKEWNWLRISRIIDYYKNIFGIDPDADAIAHLMDVHPRTVKRIMKDGEFNSYFRAMDKTKLGRDFKRVGREKLGKVTISIIVPRTHKSAWIDPIAGRPSIRYSDRCKGMPGAVAFLGELLSQGIKKTRQDKSMPNSIQALKEYLQTMEYKEKVKLAEINFDTLNENYLPEVIGAVAHRIIEIYALPSTGRVYAENHKILEDLTDRLIEIFKAYKKHTGNPSNKWINEFSEIMSENVKRKEKLAKFSELAINQEKRNLFTTTMIRRAFVIALGFKEWMTWYGRESKIGDIDKMLIEADSVAEVTNTIFNTLKDEIEGIIQSVDFENMLSER